MRHILLDIRVTCVCNRLIKKRCCEIGEELAIELAGFGGFLAGQAFEVIHADEFPLDCGHSVDNALLGGSARLVVFLEAVVEGVKLFLGFSREQDNFGKESVLDSVLGGARFALFGARSGAAIFVYGFYVRVLHTMV